MKITTKFVKEIAKILQAGNVDSSVLIEKYGQEAVEAAVFFNTAKREMDEVNSMRLNGHPLYITERIRTNCIGEKVHDKFSSTTYIARNRGKPFGTMVAIPYTQNGEKAVIVSITYLKDELCSAPITGTYIAYKKAEEAKNRNKIKWFDFPNEDNGYYLTLDSTVKYNKKQIYHFIKRAMVFFFPEEYSYSRGKNKINYYDVELHERQKAITSCKE